nr:MAG TPA: hypothetical protein [Caudoviricetes sp.]
MDGQYAPWLRAVRKVHRVLGKSSNDVTARLDHFVEIVRLGIASGYGTLLSPQCFDIACSSVL